MAYKNRRFVPKPLEWLAADRECPSQSGHADRQTFVRRNWFFLPTYDKKIFFLNNWLARVDS
jgi:hypothetical protein